MAKTQCCRACGLEVQWRYVYGKPKSYSLDWTEHQCDPQAKKQYSRERRAMKRSLTELEQSFARAIDD